MTAGFVSIAHLGRELGLLQPLSGGSILLLSVKFSIEQTYLRMSYKLELTEHTFITKGPPLSPSQASPLFDASGL